MRNILEYPITFEEKIQFLEQSKVYWNEIEKHQIGCITSLIIEEILEDLYRLDDLINS